VITVINPNLGKIGRSLLYPFNEIPWDKKWYCEGKPLSVYLYDTLEEIDLLLEIIKEIARMV
jgi:hypothetical protein